MRPVLPPTPHAIGSLTPSSSVPFVLFEALWHTRIAASQPWHRLSRDFCPVPHLLVVLYPFRQRMSRLHGAALYLAPTRSGRDKHCRPGVARCVPATLCAGGMLVRQSTPGAHCVCGGSHMPGASCTSNSRPEQCAAESRG